MTAPALQSLKDLGFNFEFASLDACATAAAARTYQYENRHAGGLQVQERAHRLLDRLHRSDNVTLQMTAWIRSCSLLRLREAAGAVTTAARARGIAPGPLDADPMDDAERQAWQRRAVTLLRPLSSPALAHARTKLGRWSIQLFPRLRTDRLLAVARL